MLRSWFLVTLAVVGLATTGMLGCGDSSGKAQILSQLNQLPGRKTALGLATSYGHFCFQPLN